MMTLAARASVLAALALAAGCGDDGGAPPVDAPPPYQRPVPVAVPLSAAGPDELLAAATGPDGTFYAAGFAAQAIGATRSVVVVKLTADGRLDGDFGTGGVATTPLDYRGENGDSELGLVVQASGKLVVEATVPNAADPDDHDVALVRVDAGGAVDPSFGDGGVRVLDLTTAVNQNGNRAGLDGARGLAQDPASGVLYAYAVSRDPGLLFGEPRTDTDFTIVKLSADGAVDASYGGGAGRFTYDLQDVSEQVHGINVLPDGSVIASGYATSPGLGSTQPVVMKVSPAGALVPDFAEGGVFHDIVLALQTEVYNVVPEGGFGVTCGYGRDTGPAAAWVSLRFDLATGARDLGWGGAAKGAVVIDPTGDQVSDNCRNAVALPRGRTLMLGTVGPFNTPMLDAAWGVLDAGGHLDAAFGPGVFIDSLGGNDSLWAGAVSTTGDRAIAVGYEGGGPDAMQTAAMNDDSYAVVIPLPP
ncbi:MAG TPA: hypothetical protein VHE35_03930 [Kofleriaceae bacterium]|nr:hypothetical protein [Kofleriaceae bacterium]